MSITPRSLCWEQGLHQVDQRLHSFTSRFGRSSNQRNRPSIVRAAAQIRAGFPLHELTPEVLSAFERSPSAARWVARGAKSAKVIFQPRSSSPILAQELSTNSDRDKRATHGLAVAKRRQHPRSFAGGFRQVAEATLEAIDSSRRRRGQGPMPHQELSAASSGWKQAASSHGPPGKRSDTSITSQLRRRRRDGRRRAPDSSGRSVGRC